VRFDMGWAKVLAAAMFVVWILVIAHLMEVP